MIASTNIRQFTFTGGTNFGFMNGANREKNKYRYLPTVTSYGKLITQVLT